MLRLGGGWHLLPVDDEGKPARQGLTIATEQQMKVSVTGAEAYSGFFKGKGNALEGTGCL